MRKPIATGLVIASGLLAALHATSVGAQTQLALVTDPVEKAVELERKAEEMYTQPGRYAQAARLHVRAAGLRSVTDPMHIRNLEMAARLFYYAGLKEEALTTMETAATDALASGDVVSAANDYVDASHLASETGRPDEAKRLSERARLLTASPLLTKSDRERINGRLSVAIF
jgi:hypothetical protein